MSANDRFVTFNAHLRKPMAKALQEEADEIGISRMALIQVILHQHLTEKATASETLSTTEREVFEELPDGGVISRPRPRTGFLGHYG